MTSRANGPLPVNRSEPSRSPRTPRRTMSFSRGKRVSYPSGDTSAFSLRFSALQGFTATDDSHPNAFDREGVALRVDGKRLEIRVLWQKLHEPAVAPVTLDRDFVVDA